MSCLKPAFMLYCPYISKRRGETCMFADGLPRSWLLLCWQSFWLCRFLLTGTMDTADSRRLIPVVRSVPWKGAQRQDVIFMMTVSIAAMIMNAVTATAPVSLFPAGEAEDIMDAIGKKRSFSVWFSGRERFFAFTSKITLAWSRLQVLCLKEKKYGKRQEATA